MDSNSSNSYLSHCYSIAWDRLFKITSVISVCVCMYVCVRALTVAILNHFDEIWHRHPEPETKEPFRWGSKSNNGIPYFYPILHQIGTHVMHFQWET